MASQPIDPNYQQMNESRTTVFNSANASESKKAPATTQTPLKPISLNPSNWARPHSSEDRDKYDVINLLSYPLSEDEAEVLKLSEGHAFICQTPYV